MLTVTLDSVVNSSQLDTTPILSTLRIKTYTLCIHKIVPMLPAFMLPYGSRLPTEWQGSSEGVQFSDSGVQGIRNSVGHGEQVQVGKRCQHIDDIITSVL